MPPHPADPKPFLNLTAMSDLALAGLACELHGEFTRRAEAAGNPAALAAAGFKRGFNAKGSAIQPWVADGVLYCPGSKQHSSRSTHQCRFVMCNGQWVWTLEDGFHDEIRQCDGLGSTQSMTLLPAFEGMVLSVVASRCSANKHTRTSLTHLEVSDGRVIPAACPPPPSDVGSHR